MAHPIDPRHRGAAAVVVAMLLLLMLAGCGRYMKLDGAITRVRVVETGSGRNVLVAEFDARNTASVPYIVKEAELEIPGDSAPVVGTTVAVSDTQTLCRHMASLNQDCAPPLTPREQIAPGETVHRLIAASFPKTARELEQRKNLILRIRELDRMETEIPEKR